MHKKLKINGEPASLFKVSLGFILLANSALGYGAEFEKFFQIKSDLSYLSNPLFSDNDKESSFSLRVNPEVQLSLNDDLNKYFLNAGLTVIENTNDDVLVDLVAPNLLGGWNRELAFGKFGLEGKYFEEASRIEQLQRTGSNANVDNITKKASLKALLNIDFNANFSLNNNLEYGNTRYSETGFLNDYELFSGDSKLIYKKSDKVGIYTQLAYTELDPDGNVLPNSDVTSLVVGGIYTPSESLTLDVNVGAYDASGRFSDNGIQAAINVTYAFNRFNTYFNAFRKMTPGGDGVFQLSDFWLIGGTYEVGENQSIGSEYFSNKSRPDREVSSFDVTYDSFGIFYSRRYENWTGRIYVNAIGLDLDGDQRRQNVIGFSLNYEPLKF
jgi:hypothetical protein